MEQSSVVKSIEFNSILVAPNLPFFPYPSPLVPPSYNVLKAVVVVVAIVLVEMMNDNEKYIQVIPRLNEKNKNTGLNQNNSKNGVRQA